LFPLLTSVQPALFRLRPNRQPLHRENPRPAELLGRIVDPRDTVASAAPAVLEVHLDPYPSPRNSRTLSPTFNYVPGYYGSVPSGTEGLFLVSRHFVPGYYGSVPSGTERLFPASRHFVPGYHQMHRKAVRRAASTLAVRRLDRRLKSDKDLAKKLQRVLKLLRV
jgi:hypothetical protein